MRNLLPLFNCNNYLFDPQVLVPRSNNQDYKRTKIEIQGVPVDYSSSDWEAFFTEIGQVVDARVIMDSATSLSNRVERDFLQAYRSVQCHV